MNLINEIEKNITKALSNKGVGNSGESNSGSLNTGSMNSGGMNSGDFNTGDYNSGSNNIGSYNSGDFNEGDFNTGSFNKGNYNTGDFNLCNDSSGIFCTGTSNIKIFDKDSNLTLEDWRKSDTYKIMSRICTSKWIDAKNMSEEEKLRFPQYRITGGYLKAIRYRDAFATLWQGLSMYEKELITKMPNFDKYKFLMITGVDVN